MNRLKIVFFGTPSFAIPVLTALEAKRWLVGAVTTPDRKVGRKQILMPSFVSLRTPRSAQLLKPERFDQQTVQHLEEMGPDLFVLAAYGKILPKEILDIPKFGALNIHPSLLPKYRGPSPIPAAILNGDKVTGVTIIKMDAEMDHGPIITTNDVSLSDQDTSAILSKKLFAIGANLLIKIIPDFVNGKVKLTKQNEKQATFTHLIKKEDGLFEIGNPPSSDQLDRMIRAYYPWPTAWTKWPFDKAQGKNNKIVKFLPGGLIQMEGKKPMELEEFLKGHPDFPIKNLSC